MINRVNTEAEAATWCARTRAEITTAAIADGLSAAAAAKRAALITPSVAAVVSTMATQFYYMDNGLAPTFASANRITLMARLEGGRMWIVHVWGPTGTLRPDGIGRFHSGVLRWLTTKMIALGNGSVVGAFDAPAGTTHPIVKAAVALATTAANRGADGRTMTITFAAADARLAANGVTAVPA